MEHLPEFFSNNSFLVIAFIVILLLTIRGEFMHQSAKTNELTPMQATRLMNNENAVIIDVSDAADFEKGHIKNAINAPMKELTKKLPNLQKYSDKAVLTCCKTGRTATRACKMLKQSGFNHVHNISGGLQNWKEANLPVVSKS